MLLEPFDAEQFAANGLFFLRQCRSGAPEDAPQIRFQGSAFPALTRTAISIGRRASVKRPGEVATDASSYRELFAWTTLQVSGNQKRVDAGSLASECCHSVRTPAPKARRYGCPREVAMRSWSARTCGQPHRFRRATNCTRWASCQAPTSHFSRLTYRWACGCEVDTGSTSREVSAGSPVASSSTSSTLLTDTRQTASRGLPAPASRSSAAACFSNSRAC